MQCVDRLTVLDGVVVATGWTDGILPTLLVDGRPLKGQSGQRYRRPDLVAHFGGQAENYGFRLSGFLEDGTDNARLSVLFQDGTVLRRNSSSGHETIDQLLVRFRTMVSDRGDGKLIEIGSRARSGNSYRSLFPITTRYCGIDITPGPNVDVVADAHTLSKAIDEEYDFAFSISVFEHLIMPWVAAGELNKVLKTGGVAYIQSHPAWPLHEQPWDFFRFSREAWTGLFNKFTGFTVIDSAYGLDAAIVPAGADGGALQGIDLQGTFLLSACLVQKTGAPLADWSVDPSEIYDLRYSHR